MQRKYITLVFCVLLCTSSAAYSQSALDSTPAKCKWNLIRNIFNKVTVTGPFYYGRLNANPKYSQVTYAGETECQLTTACTTNDTSDLKIMVYYPAGHNFDSLPLPAMIYAHAGGFSDCSYYDINGVDSMCRLFALRGFVCFNVEYRRGRIKDSNPKYRSVQHVIAAYRGSQDMRGAIRSIIKMQRNHIQLNLPFQIDTNRIFIGGASAGAVMSLMTAYYRNQAMIDSAFPVAPGTPNLKDVLGAINANFYYGDTSISLKGRIKGVLCLWGGAAIPMSFENKQTEFFRSGDSVDNPPLIAFHGLHDPVFPINGKAKQRVYFSPGTDTGVTNYNSESFCLSTSITLEGNAETPDLVNLSGLNMYNILKKLGRLTEFYEDCGAAHGVRRQCDTCLYNGYYGTNLKNERAVQGYIVQRAATFFQAVMNKATPADFTNSTTLFVNCENKRVSCNYADLDNNCSNTDTCVVTISDSFVMDKALQQNVNTNQFKLLRTPELSGTTNNGIIIYPNPVRNTLNIKGLKPGADTRIIITDVVGNIFYRTEVTNIVFTKDVSNLKPGTYYVRILGNRDIKTLLFIKE